MVIVTGGQTASGGTEIMQKYAKKIYSKKGTKNMVSVYDQNGFLENLPGLATGRHGHACGHFYDRDSIVGFV